MTKTETRRFVVQWKRARFWHPKEPSNRRDRGIFLCGYIQCLRYLESVMKEGNETAQMFRELCELRRGRLNSVIGYHVCRMKQSIEGVRVFRDHSPECVMVPDNPMWLTDHDHTVIADRIGRERRRGTSFRWIVFACNDPDCLGEVWIRHDILTRFAADLMAKALEARKK